MPKLSLSKAWDESRIFLPRDAKLYASIALAFIVLPSTIFGTIAPAALAGNTEPTATTGVMVLIVSIIGLVGRIAIANLALKPAAVSEAIRTAAKSTPAAVLAFCIFFLPIVLLLSPFVPAVMASPENPPSGPLLASTAIAIAAFIIGVRLALLIIPIAAAERQGPLAMLKSSWQLSSGNWWRLTIFLLVFSIASYIAARAVGFAIGGALILLVGPLAPYSLSALIFALILSLVGAAFTSLFSVMLARIYVQLSSGQPTVPEVKREA